MGHLTEAALEDGGWVGTFSRVSHRAKYDFFTLVTAGTSNPTDFCQQPSPGPAGTHDTHPVTSPPLIFSQGGTTGDLLL